MILPSSAEGKVYGLMRTAWYQITACNAVGRVAASFGLDEWTARVAVAILELIRSNVPAIVCEVLKWIARGRLRPKHALMVKMLAGENDHEWRYFEVALGFSKPEILRMVRGARLLQCEAPPALGDEDTDDVVAYGEWVATQRDVTRLWQEHHRRIATQPGYQMWWFQEFELIAEQARLRENARQQAYMQAWRASNRLASGQAPRLASYRPQLNSSQHQFRTTVLQLKSRLSIPSDAPIPRHKLTPRGFSNLLQNFAEKFPGRPCPFNAHTNMIHLFCTN